MLDEQIIDAAKKGDLKAISQVLEQFFEPEKVVVKANKDRSGSVDLSLVIYSKPVVDKEKCLTLVNQAFNKIKPNKISKVIIQCKPSESDLTGFWYGYVGSKNGVFVDLTEQINRKEQRDLKIGAAVISLGLVALFTSCNMMSSGNNSPEVASSVPTNTTQKKFLGKSETGYSLYLGSDDCIYVKDLTKADLSRLSVSLTQMKDTIKQQTGKRCVFFE